MLTRRPRSATQTRKDAFKGKVAAIATWDRFEYISNEPRSGIAIINHQSQIVGHSNPTLELLTRLRNESPPALGGNTFDSLIWHTAKGWIAVNRPRVVFLGFGEPDERGHEGNSGEYLGAIRRCDDHVREFWTTLQQIDIYRGCDDVHHHDREGGGDGRTGSTDWNNHGAKYPGSADIWTAIVGPDSPALGKRDEGANVTPSQVAATVAALPGEDDLVAQPNAGPVIRDALPN